MNLSNKQIDKFLKIFFYGLSAIVIIFVFIFLYFIISKSIPAFQHQGIINFVTCDIWNSSRYEFGIWNFIVGTIFVTTITLCIVTPIGIFTAIFLSEFAPKKIASIMRPLIELLIGIPSVIYGILGFLVLENIFQYHIDPFISSTLGAIHPIFYDVSPTGGSGILLTSAILSIMVVPTIIIISEDSMRSVSSNYRNASMALGATQWETIKKVIIPIATPGIITSIILGMLRAMSEATAVVMVIGNRYIFPESIFDTSATITSVIVNHVGEASHGGLVLSALFGMSIVLFIIQLIFSIILKYISKRSQLI